MNHFHARVSAAAGALRSFIGAATSILPSLPSAPGAPRSPCAPVVRGIGMDRRRREGRMFKEGGKNKDGAEGASSKEQELVHGSIPFSCVRVRALDVSARGCLAQSVSRLCSV